MCFVLNLNNIHAKNIPGGTPPPSNYCYYYYYYLQATASAADPLAFVLHEIASSRVVQVLSLIHI